MSEQLAPIDIIPHAQFAERAESGLLIPMQADGGLQVIECGDVRPLTKAAERERQERYGGEIVSGRYFGAPLGLAMATLVTMTSQAGEKFIADFVNEYSPEAFATFASDLASRAHSERDELEILAHSANSNEGNDLEIDLGHSPDIALGCAFATYAGAVLMLAGEQRAHDEANLIVSLTGQKLPLDEVHEGARILGKYLPPAFSIGRGALGHTAEHGHGHFPHTVLSGNPVDKEETAVVMDMAGYRSSARRHMEAGQPRYHHSPGIGNELNTLLPEYNLDGGLLLASSLLLGTATRGALSGQDTPNALAIEIIPHDYALAA